MLWPLRDTGVGEGLPGRGPGRSPPFDQRVVLRVTRTRWCCPAKRCGVGSWTIEHPEIAPAAQKLTTRAGRWATEQVGRYARSVAEVADTLSAAWHTINDAVIAYGEALLDADVDRIGTVRALSLDETLFIREGQWRTQRWSTRIASARSGQLLDIVEGRDAAAPRCGSTPETPSGWPGSGGRSWTCPAPTKPCSTPCSPTLRWSSTRSTSSSTPTPSSTNADAGSNQTLGHRGHKRDPLYRCRKLLLKAEERLDPAGGIKLTGLLRAGHARGEVAYAWHAKEAVRFLYETSNAHRGGRTSHDSWGTTRA